MTSAEPRAIKIIDLDPVADREEIDDVLQQAIDAGAWLHIEVMPRYDMRHLVASPTRDDQFGHS